MKRQITLKKFSSFEEAEAADDEYYLSLTMQQRLEIFIQLIGHAESKDGIVERCVRIYPITESE